MLHQQWSDRFQAHWLGCFSQQQGFQGLGDRGWCWGCRRGGKTRLGWSRPPPQTPVGEAAVPLPAHLWRRGML